MPHLLGLGHLPPEALAEPYAVPARRQVGRSMPHGGSATGDSPLGPPAPGAAPWSARAAAQRCLGLHVGLAAGERPVGGDRLAPGASRLVGRVSARPPP